VGNASPAKPSHVAPKGRHLEKRKIGEVKGKGPWGRGIPRTGENTVGVKGPGGDWGDFRKEKKVFKKSGKRGKGEKFKNSLFQTRPKKNTPVRKRKLQKEEEGEKDASH